MSAVIKIIEENQTKSIKGIFWERIFSALGCLSVIGVLIYCIYLSWGSQEIKYIFGLLSFATLFFGLARDRKLVRESLSIGRSVTNTVLMESIRIHQKDKAILRLIKSLADKPKRQDEIKKLLDSLEDDVLIIEGSEFVRDLGITSYKPEENYE